jgi:hypothetical protein
MAFVGLGSSDTSSAQLTSGQIRTRQILEALSHNHAFYPSRQRIRVQNIQKHHPTQVVIVRSKRSWSSERQEYPYITKQRSLKWKITKKMFNIVLVAAPANFESRPLRTSFFLERSSTLYLGTISRLQPESIWGIINQFSKIPRSALTASSSPVHPSRTIRREIRIDTLESNFHLLLLIEFNGGTSVQSSRYVPPCNEFKPQSLI